MQSAHGFLVLVLCVFLGGCSTFTKPDNCAHVAECPLSVQSRGEPIELKAGESREVLICACRSWNASGLLVRSGQVYRFDISDINHWQDSSVNADPVQGWQGDFARFMGALFAFLKRSDQTPWYALVGVIGKENGPDFAVKPGEPWSVPEGVQAEQLYVYANDMNGRYFNNHGSLKLKITLLPSDG